MHGPRHPAAGVAPAVIRPGIHKVRRAFGDPVAARKPHPRFVSPPFTNNLNLNLPLDVALRDPDEAKRIRKAKRLVFHCVGDTGGIHGTETQESIAHAMEAQIQSAAEADRAAFFYHLGDVIYFNGQSEDYETQFYDPYKFYPAPIFAIPGNHDGDIKVQRGDAPVHELSLTGFVENFCTAQPVFHSAYRPTMTQPYVYWTLETPFGNIVGLYSNVDGSLDGRGTFEQQRWLEEQMAGVPQDRWLLIAVHHPPYSLDGAHGGSPEVLDALDRAAEQTGRWPDAVFSGHVHAYERFTRTVDGGREIPFVVAGAGGYANERKSLHKMQLDSNGKEVPNKRFKTTLPDVVLEHYNDEQPGFLRVELDATTLTVEYFVVPFDDAPPTKPDDRFVLNLQTHKVK